MTHFIVQRHNSSPDSTPTAAITQSIDLVNGTEVQARDLLGMARRNVGLIVACVTLFVGTAAFLMRRLAPIYEGSTTLRIDQKESGLPALDILQKDAAGNQIDTEKEMLASRIVAEDVTDSLALQLHLVHPERIPSDSFFADVRVTREARGARYEIVGDSHGRWSLRDTSGTAIAAVRAGETVKFAGVEFRLTSAAAKHGRIEFEILPFDDAVDALRDAVTIDRPNRDASMVRVRYRGTDPALAQRVPNAVATRFIARRHEARQSATHSTIVLLREQEAKLSAQLHSAEDALRAFRRRERAVNLPEQARTQISHLADLHAQRGALETERSALARLVTQVQSTAKQHPGALAPYRDLLAFPTFLRSQNASQLLTSLTAVEDRRTDLLARRSPSDPDVRLLTERAGQLEQQFLRSAETYLQALTDQVSSIDSTLAQSAEELQNIPDQETQLARHERDVKGLEDIYSLVRGRLKEAEIATRVQDGSVYVVDRAVRPRLPVSPKPMRMLAISLAIGLFVGVFAAFAREASDTAVHSRQDVQDIAGVPVLGLLPQMRRGDRGLAAVRRAVRAVVPESALRAASGSVTAQVEGLAAGTDKTWRAAREVFNGLQAYIAFAMPPEAPRTIVVTSPAPGDGKSTVAVNLAATVARQGQKVLLVDADMRLGIVHSALGLPRAPGLSEVLSGASDLGGSLRVIPLASGRSLHVLSSGTPTADPAELLGPARIRALLARVGPEFDWVIVDSPPLNVVADSALLASTGAAVLLVARAGVTPSGALSYAVQQLRSVHATVVGAVLNGLTKREASYDRQHSAYSAYEEYGAAYDVTSRGVRRQRLMPVARELPT